MSKFIVPTIGRKVWFWSCLPVIDSAQPEDATICYVHNDCTVNLRVTDHNGDSRPEHYVHLILSNAEKQSLAQGAYATWMPYQIGQAEKYAEEKTAADVIPLQILPTLSLPPLPSVLIDD